MRKISGTNMLADIRTREDIARLVDAFYGQAMTDDVIGYIFTDVARLDLQAHLPTMYDFWETMLLGARTYQGGAMPKHLELHRRSPLRAEHFERWLQIWERTVEERFAGPVADEAIQRAHAVARSMLLRVGSAVPRFHGIAPGRSERY
jgi:hemoglobin